MGIVQYKLISIAHHNYDWLNRSEIFSDDHETEPPINQLFERSILHLTGHEHAKPSIASKIGNCTILRNGMFLDNSVSKPGNKFPNNWYSIVRIDDRNIKHQYYNYHSNDNKWIEDSKTYKCSNDYINESCLFDDITNVNFLNFSSFVSVVNNKYKKAVNEELRNIEKKLSITFFSVDKPSMLSNRRIQSKINSAIGEFGIKPLSFNFLSSDAPISIVDHKTMFIFGMIEIFNRDRLPTYSALQFQINNYLQKVGQKKDLERIIFVELLFVNLDVDKYKDTVIYTEITKKISKSIITIDNSFNKFTQRIKSFEFQRTVNEVLTNCPLTHLVLKIKDAD